MAKNKRHRNIIEALQNLGGEATTKEIADKLELSVNGVAQSLKVIEEVEMIGGKGGETKWKIKKGAG